MRDIVMSDLSIGMLIESERQRIKRRCVEIDEQFDALGEERQALMTIGEALNTLEQLYDRTGQTVDASLAFTTAGAVHRAPQPDMGQSEAMDPTDRLKLINRILETQTV